MKVHTANEEMDKNGQPVYVVHNPERGDEVYGVAEVEPEQQ